MADKLRVPGIEPELQSMLDGLGARYAAAFAAQFAAEPLPVRFHFHASRFIRRVFADCVWPGPAWSAAPRGAGRRLAIPAPELLGDPDIARLFETVDHDREGGAFVFGSGVEPLGFMAGLLVGLQANPPARAAEGEPVNLEIPDRLGELQPQWAAQPRTRPLLNLITALRRSPPPPGVTPILFGSLAGPPPWPAYADVDLAIYLDTRARDDVFALFRFVAQFRRLARHVLAVDPIQHHGPYILLESDLPVYPASLLPPETLRRATTLTGRPLPLTITPLAEDRIHSLEALAAAWRGLRHLAARAPRTFLDRYTAKTWSSLALLVPALACGCLGRPVEKSESFAILKSELDSESIATIEAIERFRREWHWTLPLPAPLLALAGSRALWLSRTFNRWPAPAAAARLRELAPRVDPLFAAILRRLCDMQ